MCGRRLALIGVRCTRHTGAMWRPIPFRLHTREGEAGAASMPMPNERPPHAVPSASGIPGFAWLFGSYLTQSPSSSRSATITNRGVQIAHGTDTQAYQQDVTFAFFPAPPAAW